MEKLSVFILMSFLPSFCDTIDFHNHKFYYELNNKWNISNSKSDSGYLDKWFKRDEIKDSKGILVIPNIEIKLINIDTATDFKPDKNINELEIFIKLCLMNFAPPEVMEDYKNSIKLKSKYKFPFQNSYIFNSPYIDNFKCNHTCLYCLIYNKQKYGIFIVIDSTEEIFKQIENEIELFIKSIKII